MSDSASISPRKIRVGILTISDKCYAGITEDLSGTLINDIVINSDEFGTHAEVTDRRCVPDDVTRIKAILQLWSDVAMLDLVLTTGGTGMSPRDVTAKATEEMLDRKFLGISIGLIAGSLSSSPYAMTANPVCGVRKNTLIINLPGSTKGCLDYLRILNPVIEHVIDVVKDDKKSVDKKHEEMAKENMSLLRQRMQKQSIVSDTKKVIITNDIAKHSSDYFEQNGSKFSNKLVKSDPEKLIVKLAGDSGLKEQPGNISSEISGIVDTAKRSIDRDPGKFKLTDDIGLQSGGSNPKSLIECEDIAQHPGDSDPRNLRLNCNTDKQLAFKDEVHPVCVPSLKDNAQSVCEPFPKEYVQPVCESSKIVEKTSKEKCIPCKSTKEGNRIETRMANRMERYIASNLIDIVDDCEIVVHFGNKSGRLLDRTRGNENEKAHDEKYICEDGVAKDVENKSGGLVDMKRGNENEKAHDEKYIRKDGVIENLCGNLGDDELVCENDNDGVNNQPISGQSRDGKYVCQNGNIGAKRHVTFANEVTFKNGKKGSEEKSLINGEDIKCDVTFGTEDTFKNGQKGSEEKALINGEDFNCDVTFATEDTFKNGQKGSEEKALINGEYGKCDVTFATEDTFKNGQKGSEEKALINGEDFNCDVTFATEDTFKNGQKGSEEKALINGEDGKCDVTFATEDKFKKIPPLIYENCCKDIKLADMVVGELIYENGGDETKMNSMNDGTRCVEDHGIGIASHDYKSESVRHSKEDDHFQLDVDNKTLNLPSIVLQSTSQSSNNVKSLNLRLQTENTVDEEENNIAESAECHELAFDEISNAVSKIDECLDVLPVKLLASRIVLLMSKINGLCPRIATLVIHRAMMDITQHDIFIDLCMAMLRQPYKTSFQKDLKQACVVQFSNLLKQKHEIQLLNKVQPANHERDQFSQDDSLNMNSSAEPDLDMRCQNLAKFVALYEQYNASPFHSAILSILYQCYRSATAVEIELATILLTALPLSSIEAVKGHAIFKLLPEAASEREILLPNRIRAMVQHLLKEKLQNVISCDLERSEKLDVDSKVKTEDEHSDTAEICNITENPTMQQLRNLIRTKTTDITVELGDALLRKVAKNIYASQPFPSYPVSMKDGYAVNSREGTGIREVTGFSVAESIPGEMKLTASSAIRVTTGAPIPEFADAVVQVEDTILVSMSLDCKQEHMVDIRKSPVPGQDIRKIGADVNEGELVLKGGTELGPCELGILATFGINKFDVFSEPKIALLSIDAFDSDHDYVVQRFLAAKQFQSPAYVLHFETGTLSQEIENIVPIIDICDVTLLFVTHHSEQLSQEIVRKYSKEKIVINVDIGYDGAACEKIVHCDALGEVIPKIICAMPLYEINVALETCIEPILRAFYEKNGPYTWRLN